ncbi:MAG TPA: methyl-accepting chemotaxis protein [Aquabacterium sp.]|nr:methyl-accepting chemotaxis protein [Aquabacterium sp.]
MNQLTVAQKFILLVLTAVIGVGILAGVARVELTKVYDEANYANANVVPSLLLLAEAADEVANLRTRTWRRLADSDPAHNISLDKQIAEDVAQLEAALKKYESYLDDERDKALLAADRVAVTDFINMYHVAAKLDDENKTAAAVEHMVSNQALIDKLINAFKEHREYNVELGKRGAEAASATQQTANTISMVVSAATLLVIGLTGWGIARSLLKQLGGEPAYAAEVLSKVGQGDFAVQVHTKPDDTTSMLASVKRMTENLDVLIGGQPDYAAKVVRKVASGDLTVQVRTKPDDTSSMLAAIRDMTEKLSQVIGDVNTASDALSAASEQVSSTAQSISQGAGEQAASVEEISATVEQASSSIAQNTENAKLTEVMSSKAAKEAVEGGQAVKETVQAMKIIADKIGIVDDIAYQTNLLALNAAIEAARAGEHGKGFAVVAEEVRKLAERSQEAAQEIGEVAKSSVSLAERAGTLLEAIVPSISKTSDLVQEIASASEEQSSGIGQINTAMTQLSQLTQANSSASEELAATAEEMSGQAEQLQELMTFFTTSGSAHQRPMASTHGTRGVRTASMPPNKAKPVRGSRKGAAPEINAHEFVRFEG